MADHDQRFKTLLQTFLREFFEAFLPEWAGRFDFEHVEWLETEAFPDPSKGERRSLDLVARLPLSDAYGSTSAAQDWLSLIHIEVESGESVAAFRPRFCDDFSYLRWRHRRPILPVALFLNVGLDGIGIDGHSEAFGPLEVLRLQYLSIGLRALDAERLLAGENALAAALVGLMRAPEGKRARLKADALDVIRVSGRNDWKLFLLVDCLDAYFPLSGTDLIEYEELMATHEREESRNMVRSILDEAREEGVEEGREEGSRRMVLSLLQRRFSPSPQDVPGKVAQLPAERLVDFAERIFKVRTLEGLWRDN